MRTRAGLAVLVALATLPPTALGQATEPSIGERAFDQYDLGSLKGGEWVEYRTTSEMAMGSGEWKPMSDMSYRVACVLAEPETIWFESSQYTLGNPAWKGTVVLAAVAKKSGLVTQAWWGKPGETGKEIKVAKMPEGKPSTDTTGTGRATRETVKAGGLEYECEKIEIELTSTFNGMESKSKMTSWNGEKVPFKGKDLSAVAKAGMERLAWDGKPTWKGWLVKSVLESKMDKTRSKSTTELQGCGTDAKQTLKK
ncbi:MAG: hypothetical protein AAB074_03215 [Planctomycetota bacterium]